MNRIRVTAVTWFVACGLSGGVFAAAPVQSESAISAPAASGRVVRDGVAIEFEATPLGGTKELVEGAVADVRFKVTDATSGQPLAGLSPGAWLDIGKEMVGGGGEQKECREKIALYLKGVVGVRPMVDLNGYYLMVLNKDPSITVIDPSVSVGGVTSTLTSIVLKRQPMDWVKNADGKRIYVSMPQAGQVAVVDAGNFTVVGNVDAGVEPVRVALQPDGRYLWVGNNARDESESGVTVIDTQTLKPVLSAATGKGHHEIAFSADSRHAFVTNRDSGTVSVFDVEKLKKLKTLNTGKRPISAAASPLSKAIYIADGETGTITAIDGQTFEIRKVIKAKPGLGPMRFTLDGRWGFALNPFENTVTVVDAGSDEVVHTVEVTAEPYQVTFTRAFAYIRGLASQRVTMINLSTLGAGLKPTVQAFEAGPNAPKLAGNLPLADSLAVARDDAAVFVVNPVDNTTYFYMEGMNAPMSGYSNRGHTARAATVVDRSMKESSPGVFTSQIRMPSAGRFDVAFLLDRPQVMHCFTADVKPSAVTEAHYALPKVEFLDPGKPVAAPATVPVRFKLVAGRDSQPKTGVKDLTVRYFLAPASRPQEAPAREVEVGVYEAMVSMPEMGAYYVHVGSSSLRINYGDQPYTSLRALPPKAAGRVADAGN